MALHNREGQAIQQGGTVGYQQDEALRINDERLSYQVDLDYPTKGHLKEQLNITHDQDDSHITRLRDRAIDYFERVTSHYIRKQKRRVTFDGVTRQFEIPAVPWVSLEQVEVLDEGQTQTLQASDFFVRISPLSIITANSGTQLPMGDTLRATYVAGYGGTDAIPGAVGQSLTMMVADLYEHRTSAPIVGQTLEEAPFNWSRLLAPHRVITT